MNVFFVLILFMLGIGFLARKYDGWVRFLLLLGITALVLYATLKPL